VDAEAARGHDAQRPKPVERDRRWRGASQARTGVRVTAVGGQFSGEGAAPVTRGSYGTRFFLALPGKNYYPCTLTKP
jgi:hypothetical protein